MEDYEKTYFASLVCNRPDGKHKRSVCALRNSIHIYLLSAWSLRIAFPSQVRTATFGSAVSA